MLTATRFRADYSLFEWDYISIPTACQYNAQKVHNFTIKLRKTHFFSGRYRMICIHPFFGKQGISKTVLFPRMRIY